MLQSAGTVDYPVAVPNAAVQAEVALHVAASPEQMFGGICAQPVNRSTVSDE